MTEEEKQAVEKLNKIREDTIKANECGISNNDFKEEIEDIKVDLRILHQVLWDEHRVGTDTIQRTLEYIQELEFQNTALKAEHNHNITRIKKLEQKEIILDKVTDKLKEDINRFDKVIKDRRIWGEQKVDFKKYKNYAINLLNIIEGENHE